MNLYPHTIYKQKAIVQKSLFGSTVAEVMEVQRKRFPERKIPWILSTLTETVFEMHALTTEGIFR